MRAALASVLALVACGRVGFEPGREDAGVADEGPRDGDAGSRPDAPPGTTSSCGAAACTCPATCEMECLSGRCDFACTGGAPCTIVCDAAPCDIVCEGSTSCIYSCAAGGCMVTVREAASVQGSCSRDCAVECEGPSSCDVSCDQPATCACTGFGCT